MTFHRWIVSAASLLIFLNGAKTSKADDSLDPLLKPYLEKYGLPALAAAVVKDGTIIAAGAVGTRRFGENIPVTVDDRFHLGSDTKAMTSLIAGMLVDEGKLRWDSTVAELFPEQVETMTADLRGVTLRQLLSHTSGIPSDNATSEDLIVKSMTKPGNLDEQRAWLVREWFGQPLESKPGSKFAYANMNYVIAGAMIERVAKKTWEELIVGRVFTPLDLKTAGLGPQSSLGRVDAPLGHETKDGKTRSFLSGPNGDNPPVVGPAGTAHMSVLDFARWAGWNAGRGKRGPHLVKPETMIQLQTIVISMELKKDAAPGTPKSGGYGLGWGVLSVPWGSNPFVFHGGSNTMNLAHIWLDPAHDLGMVLMTNISNPKADEALKDLAPKLYELGTAKK